MATCLDEYALIYLEGTGKTKEETGAGRKKKRYRPLALGGRKGPTASAVPNDFTFAKDTKD